MWKQFYKTASGSDPGTLYQLRNLINRRNVIKKPMDNLAACEDFIVLVTESHILSAAKTLFGMDNLADTPSEIYFPKQSSQLDSGQRQKLLLLAAKQLVDKFVDITIPTRKPSSGAPPSLSMDHVFAYACDLLSNGLLLLELKDGIHEGDGNRIIRCWRYMLLIFKTTNRKNYAIEAFNLLMQLEHVLSPRMAAQLKWNRTVNVHGQQGKNISADLHMEHLNKECKTILSGMGSNITEQSVLRVSRALKPLCSTMQAFDRNNEVPDESGRHTTKSNAADLGKVVKQLSQSKVFSEFPERTHKQFPKFCPNTMLKIDEADLKQWMEVRARQLVIYH